MPDCSLIGPPHASTVVDICCTLKHNRAITTLVSILWSRGDCKSRLHTGRCRPGFLWCSLATTVRSINCRGAHLPLTYPMNPYWAWTWSILDVTLRPVLPMHVKLAKEAGVNPSSLVIGCGGAHECMTRRTLDGATLISCHKMATCT